MDIFHSQETTKQLKRIADALERLADRVAPESKPARPSMESEIEDIQRQISEMKNKSANRVAGAYA